MPEWILKDTSGRFPGIFFWRTAWTNSEAALKEAIGTIPGKILGEISKDFFVILLLKYFILKILEEFQRKYGKHFQMKESWSNSLSNFCKISWRKIFHLEIIWIPTVFFKEKSFSWEFLKEFSDDPINDLKMTYLREFLENPAGLNSIPKFPGRMSLKVS